MPHRNRKNIDTIGRLGRKVKNLHGGLSSIHETTRLLTSPMDLPQVLEMVVRTVTDSMNLKAAGLRLLDEETGQLVLKATYGLSDEYKNKGEVTATESTLNRKALHGQAVIVDDMRTDPNFKKHHKAILNEGIVSSLSIGLMYRDKGIGILRLYSANHRAFSEDNINLARTIASQSAAAIVNARLYRDALEAERLTEQMKTAAEVQRHLLPLNCPTIPDVDIAGRYVPCHELGGDIYDYIALENDRVMFVIGDIMGKGLPAALTMASLRATIRAYADAADTFEDFIHKVNKMFYRDTEGAEFATLFCGMLGSGCSKDKKYCHMTYCNCGHEPPILLRGDHTIDLNDGGMVLGIDPDNKYDIGTIQLEKGDMIVMYTDGLADACNFNRERFGRERIIEAIKSSSDMTANQAVKNILWLMRKFTGLTRRVDDTALVVIKLPE
ncbi:MAG: SpoIIE family protein phosphatase [Phycisphaerae bacterium]|nr:SpoIIE family protein phosphatase [Phycisphaerae bacterium]